MRSHSRLRTRVILAVTGDAVLVAVGMALLLDNTIGLRNTADSTVRADDYLSRVINVERLTLDLETGLRGYVITGRRLFLQPLHNARVQFGVTRRPGRRSNVERFIALTVTGECA